MSGLFKNIFGGKPWYESLTAWGLVLLVAAESALQSGLIPSEAATWVTYAGSIAVALGIRKAATSRNVR